MHYPVQHGWIEAAGQSGARWTRLDIFFWDQIEPVKSNPPVYDWSQIDEASLKDISASGLQLSAVILFTPDWAQKYPGVACGPIAEAEIERFAQFMHALVARYSQPPYNIRYWEIGNEPDIDHTLVSPRSGFGCWGEADDPYYGGGYYAQVLKAVYPQVKAADPQAQVLVGGLLLDCDPEHPPLDTNGQAKNCAPARFLEGVLKAGGGAYLDGVSFHAYDYYYNALGQYGNPNWNADWRTTGPAWIPKVAYLRNLLGAAGMPETPLFLTELATICGRDGSEDYCHTPDLEQTKAIYVVQSLAAGKAEGLQSVIWFGITGWRASGMLQGSTPLPVYHALSFFQATIADTEFTSRIQEYPGVQGYVFTRADQETWVLWSADGNGHQIELPGIPGAIYNVAGQKLDTSQSIEITVSPVYLRW